MPTIKEESLTEDVIQNLINETNQDIAATTSNIMERYIGTTASLIGYGWEEVGTDYTAILTRQDWRNWVMRARRGQVFSPLIAAGVRAYELLVWSDGVAIQAEDEDLNDIIQFFLATNKKSFTSQQEQQNSEKNLRVDGNIFLKLHTDTENGNIIVRECDPLQIMRIVCNPKDEIDVWIYERQYNQVSLSGDTEFVTIGYPDVNFYADDQLRAQIESALGYTVMWDTPMMHTAVNKTQNFKFGLPEFVASIPWARASERILEHFATIQAAYAAFAILIKVRADKIAAAKTKLTRVLPGADTGQGNMSPTKGSTAFLDDTADISTLKTNGSTTPPSQSLELFEMVYMDFGLPPEAFGKQQSGGIGDGDSRYTLLKKNVQSRQELWTDVYQQLFDYVKLQAVKFGSLSGNIVVVNFGDGLQEVVDWPDSFNATVDMTFPPLDKENALEMLNALIDAVTLKGQVPNGVVSPKQYMMQVAKAFKMDIDFGDIDDNWSSVTAAVEAEVMSVLGATIEAIETAVQESES